MSCVAENWNCLGAAPRRVASPLLVPRNTMTCLRCHPKGKFHFCYCTIALRLTRYNCAGCLPWVPLQRNLNLVAQIFLSTFLFLYMSESSSFIPVFRAASSSKSSLKPAPVLEKKDIATPPPTVKRDRRHVKSQSPVEDVVTIKYVCEYELSQYSF